MPSFPVHSVSISGMYVCALKNSDNSLYCWGSVVPPGYSSYPIYQPEVPVCTGADCIEVCSTTLKYDGTQILMPINGDNGGTVVDAQSDTVYRVATGYSTMFTDYTRSSVKLSWINADGTDLGGLWPNSFFVGNSVAMVPNLIQPVDPNVNVELKAYTEAVS